MPLPRLNATAVFAAARARFGDGRCLSVNFWEH
jgi:hypothetical protein